MATITAKLVASERDADAARVRAKLKAARMGGKKKRISLAPPMAEVEADATRSTRSEGTVAENGDADADELAPGPADQKPLPKKRERRTSRVASRRRSTLNPWELETLIKGTGDGIEGEEEGR